MKTKTYPEPILYRPINPEKYAGDVRRIVMRSSWESKFAHWVDTNPNVLKWGSEIKAIPYLFSVDKKMHRYFPDFWVILKDKDGNIKKYIIEIKPLCQVNKPRDNKRKKRETYVNECITWIQNQNKWDAAKQYAEQNGFEFKILTEKELMIK